MASFNKITIVGYLGKDPELRYTPQGVPVCDFSVATTERKKDKAGEFQDLTTWFRVTFWRNQAELANQYLSKGRQVYIEGRLSQREYQDRDGNTRYSLKYRVQIYVSSGLDRTKGSHQDPATERRRVKNTRLRSLQSGSLMTISRFRKRVLAF